MPRVPVDDKALFTFVKGLITEATGTTYPPNSMVDGVNVDVDVSGKCSRRKGLDYEVGYSLFGDTLTEEDRREIAITFHPWESVSNVGENNLWVLQVGTKLIIGDLNSPILSSATFGTFELAELEIDTRSFYTNTPIRESYIVNAELASRYPLTSTYGKGRLFFNSKYINPFYLELDVKTGLLDIKPIVLRERDFQGLDDGFDVDDRPLEGANNDDHTYNLINQGWGDSNPNTVGGSGTATIGQATGSSTGGSGGGAVHQPINIPLVDDIIRSIIDTVGE